VGYNLNLSLGNKNHKNCEIEQILFFKNKFVKDIESSKYSSIAITNENELFVWGKFKSNNTTPIKICNLY
jgi:hypothetical protein